MLRLGGRTRGLAPLLSLLLAALAAASSDVFDNQLGDISYCKKQCQLTIKNKSPAKVSHCCVSVRGDGGVGGSLQKRIFHTIIY